MQLDALQISEMLLTHVLLGKIEAAETKRKPSLKQRG